MRFAVSTIAALITPTVIVFFLALIRYFSEKESQKMTNRSFCVRSHKSFSLVSVAWLAMSTCIYIGLQSDKTYLSNVTFRYGMDAFLAMMFFLSIYLIIFVFMHKIVVNGNVITVFYVFRRHRTFSFNDIVRVKRKVVGHRWQVEKFIVETSGGKKFSFESTEIAYDRFVKALCNKVIRSKLIGFEDSDFRHSRKDKK